MTPKNEMDVYNEDLDNKDDTGSQMDVESSTGGGSRPSRREDVREVEELAAKENRAVWYLRVLVFALLLTVAVLACAGVYVYSSKTEQDEFESGFASYGTLIKRALTESTERKMGSLASLSNSITSHALYSNSEFPFVTLPDYVIHGSDIRVLSQAFSIRWCPMVTDEKRDQWEVFAEENRFHINEAYDLDTQLISEQDEQLFSMEQDQDQHGQDHQSTRALEEGGEAEVVIPVEGNVLQDGAGFRQKIANPLANLTAEPPGAGPYFPTWQITGVNPSKQGILNVNFAHAKIAKGIFPVLLEDKKDPKVVMGGLSVPQPQFHKRSTANIKASQYRHQVDTYLQDALTLMVYPVFDSFHKENRTLAGAIVAQIYWRLEFLNLLPADVKGVICVLQNSYNQTYSYRLDGPDVTSLGFGDFHDTAYDDMRVSQDISSVVQNSASAETRAYLTVPLHDTAGLYTLTVYPTNDTEQQYISNKPMAYTAAVALIFVITALVFLVFDWYVEKRQAKVMTRALQSGAIVNSLFPEDVAHRLYKEQGDKEKQNEKTKNFQVQEQSMEMGTSHSADKTQIAQLYPETTCFFGDLAGFTHWSSSRSPSEVFLLLETLYSAFDAIADRRGVFKVETIGDCYVAITGCPNAQKRHASIMVRFARDCIAETNILLGELEARLGPGTAELGLRIGLHSGPVTAGVLRGAKARFQLYGDTVNTTARMESNGVKGRIHVSSATADKLKASGYGAWLQARDEPVFAKGKGMMNTYFVTGGDVARTAVSSLDDKSGITTSSVDENDRYSDETPSEAHNMTETTPVTLGQKIATVVENGQKWMRLSEEKFNDELSV